MPQIKAVIFDLDNVLYDESTYFLAAFKDISIFLSKYCSLTQEQIYNKLVSDLKKKTSMYNRLFNDLLEDLQLSPELLSTVLSLFTNVKANIALYPEAGQVLQKLKSHKIKLALVTNGNVLTQKNKVNLLNLYQFFDIIIYARELGKEKPDPNAYQIALNALNAIAQDCFCVGDNPMTDFSGAKTLGLNSIRLKMGELKDFNPGPEYEADVSFRNLIDVCDYILQQNVQPLIERKR